jgi:hypothetical protein
MLAWLRNLFRQVAGRARTDRYEVDEAEWERFTEAKQQALERVLGPMHDMVGHAVIPFAIGGSVDMYAFPNALPGTAFVTQELINLGGSGPRPGKIGTYELIGFTRHSPKRAGEEPVEFRKMEQRFCGIFTGIANYSFQEELNPHETCEAPGGDAGPAQILLDEFVPERGEFRIDGRKHGLLLCIEVLPLELSFARKHGSKVLLKKLKDAGHYPYSDLDRAPVV